MPLCGFFRQDMPNQSPLRGGLNSGAFWIECDAGARLAVEGDFPGSEYSADEVDLLRAMDRYRRERRRKFPAVTEVLAVIESLGWRRVAKPRDELPSWPPVRDAKELPTKRWQSWREVEATAVRQALERCGGSVPRAAAELGVSRQALYQKLARARTKET